MTADINNGRALTKPLVICDDTSWIWNFINTTFRSHNVDHLRMPSSFSLQNNWARFKHTKKFVIVWENNNRPHGSIVEELQSIDSTYNVGENVIVVTSAPSRQDVVYFHELGIFKIVKIENDKKQLDTAGQVLVNYVTAATDAGSPATAKLHRLLDMVIKRPTKELLDLAVRIEDVMQSKSSSKTKATMYDVSATIAFAHGEYELSIENWEKALGLNPNYYRAINNLIRVYTIIGEHETALALQKKMHICNSRNLARITAMGQTYLNLKNAYMAEGCFTRVIEKDNFFDVAKSGMAEVKFMQGNLVAAKDLLSQVKSCDNMAAGLNRKGIELVHAGLFKEALRHYSQAHYILPDQSKSALIFYNMGLCYWRWGNFEMAEKYLHLALIKNPKYHKATKLLERIQEGGKQNSNKEKTR